MCGGEWEVICRRESVVEVCWCNGWGGSFAEVMELQRTFW